MKHVKHNGEADESTGNHSRNTLHISFGYFRSHPLWTNQKRPASSSLQLLNPDASRPLLLRMVPGQPQRWPYWDFARLGQWSGAVSQDSSNWNSSCISWKVKKNSSDEKQRRKKSYLVALQASSLSSLWCLVVLKCSFRVILLAFVSHEIIIFICDYIHYQGS